MDKLLIMGDSIRVGYQKYVEELAKDKFTVLYPVDNSCFVQYQYWQINQMFKHNDGIKYVHFNSGYWDMNIESPMEEALNPIEEYLHGLTKIVTFIRKQGAFPVFATTVPIYESGLSNDNTGKIGSINYKNEWVINYNKHAKILMNELNVPVHDLYEVVLKGDKYYKCEDLLHLTEEGSKICAESIVEFLTKL